MIKIGVILGSVRQGRFGEKPARWIFDELKKRKGVEATFLDLKDYNLPNFDEAVSPAWVARAVQAGDCRALDQGRRRRRTASSSSRRNTIGASAAR